MKDLLAFHLLHTLSWRSRSVICWGKAGCEVVFFLSLFVIVGYLTHHPEWPRLFVFDLGMAIPTAIMGLILSLVVYFVCGIIERVIERMKLNGHAHRGQ